MTVQNGKQSVPNDRYTQWVLQGFREQVLSAGGGPEGTSEGRRVTARPWKPGRFDA